MQGGFVRLPTEPLRPGWPPLLELVGERGVDFRSPACALSRPEALRAGAAPGRGRGVAGCGVAAGPGAEAPGRQPHRRGAPARHACMPACARTSRQGLNWLQPLRAQGLGGILADDMGLGKTLQTLAHIQVERDAGRLTAPRW